MMSGSWVCAGFQLFFANHLRMQIRDPKTPIPDVKWPGGFAFQAGILDPVKQQTHYAQCGSNLAKANLSETLNLSLFTAMDCRTLCQATPTWSQGVTSSPGPFLGQLDSCHDFLAEQTRVNLLLAKRPYRITIQSPSAFKITYLCHKL